jgi:hypothetical protein
MYFSHSEVSLYTPVLRQLQGVGNHCWTDALDQFCIEVHQQGGKQPKIAQ